MKFAESSLSNTTDVREFSRFLFNTKMLYVFMIGKMIYKQVRENGLTTNVLLMKQEMT